MKYKPGDRVLVKPVEELKLWGGRALSDLPRYTVWADKVVTIAKIADNESYQIEEMDPHCNLWIDESFVGLASDELASVGCGHIESVITVQITDIVRDNSPQVERFIASIDPEKLAKFICERLGADNVTVLEQKYFVK